jgi:hypothetical protein
MTESARDEALRQFTEWFVRNYPGPDTIICKPEWHAPKIFRAVEYAMLVNAPKLVEEIDSAIARQRPGWVWVPEKGNDAIFAAGMSYDSRFTRLLVEAMWKSMLAAAPKPEEGE